MPHKKLCEWYIASCLHAYMPLNAKSIEIYNCISDIRKTLQDMKTLCDGFGPMIHNYSNSIGSANAQRLFERWIRVEVLLSEWILQLHILENDTFDTRDVFENAFLKLNSEVPAFLRIYKTYEDLIRESISICESTSKINFPESGRSPEIQDQRPYREIKKIWTNLTEDLEFLQRHITRIKKKPVSRSGIQQPRSDLHNLLARLRQPMCL